MRARARAPARPRKFRGEPARSAGQAVGRGGNIGREGGSGKVAMARIEADDRRGVSGVGQPSAPHAYPSPAPPKFEYHCWASVLSDAGGTEADGELLRALEARIAELSESVRKSFHIGYVSEVTVTAPGVRNHWRSAVLDVFYWLARQSRRSYGLLYFRDAHVEPDQPYRFRVQREFEDCRLAANEKSLANNWVCPHL